MKKIKLLLVFAVLFLSITLISCRKNQQTTNLNLKNDDDLLAFYSLTSANILSNASKEETRNIRTKKLLSATSEEGIDINTVNTYLQMMESMFSDKAPFVINSGKSDREGYETKVVFEVTDLSGKKDSITLYYNQTELVEEQDEDDMFENEKEYRLEGVAVIEGIEYQIKGEKEIENDESSLDIKVILDENNYVVIEQEIENNEQEYEYEVYKNGKKYTSISFEVEDGKEFEAEFSTREKGYLETYRFYKEGNKVKIKYRSNEKVFTIKATASIDPETNETVYEYKVMENNSEYKFRD